MCLFFFLNIEMSATWRGLVDSSSRGINIRIKKLGHLFFGDWFFLHQELSHLFMGTFFTLKACHLCKIQWESDDSSCNSSLRFEKFKNSFLSYVYNIFWHMLSLAVWSKWLGKFGNIWKTHLAEYGPRQG